MSTDLHKDGHAGAGDPHHETVSFETSDVETKSILVYLLYLAIAVGVSGAVDDLRVVEEGVSVNVFGVAQLLKESRELLDVPEVDSGHFLNQFGHVLVV